MCFYCYTVCLQAYRESKSMLQNLFRPQWKERKLPPHFVTVIYRKWGHIPQMHCFFLPLVESSTSVYTLQTGLSHPAASVIPTFTKSKSISSTFAS